MDIDKKETALEEQFDINTALLAETLRHVYQLEEFIYVQYQTPPYQGKI